MYVELDFGLRPTCGGKTDEKMKYLTMLMMSAVIATASQSFHFIAVISKLCT